MRILVENNSKVVRYIFDGTESVVWNVDYVETDSMRILDLNSSNSSLVSVASVPEGVTPSSHKYLNSTWIKLPVEVEEL